MITKGNKQKRQSRIDSAFALPKFISIYFVNVFLNPQRPINADPTRIKVVGSGIGDTPPPTRFKKNWPLSFESKPRLSSKFESDTNTMLPKPIPSDSPNTCMRSVVKKNLLPLPVMPEGAP